MAGRYESNPFDEEEVNPFSVSSSPYLLFVKVLIFLNWVWTVLC
jgi:hypothetical protein